jgi:hypothetical protein
MFKTFVRRRFYVQTALAIVATSLAVLTLVWPDWIEALTGSDPDAGSGSAEWLIVGGLFLVAAASGSLARREYRQGKPKAA